MATPGSGRTGDGVVRARHRMKGILKEFDKMFGSDGEDDEMSRN
jgi:hypothetical protein